MGKFWWNLIIAKKIGEIELDLSKEELYSWESPKSSLVVAVMIEGIKLGHKFPMVPVSRCGKVCRILGDGHHTALAHYIYGVPLKSLLLGDNNGEFDGGFPIYEGFPIGEVILTDFLNNSDMQRLKNSLSYLPWDVAKKFCCENGLDFGEYLSQ